MAEESTNVKLAVIQTDLTYIKSEVKDIKGSIGQRFVTKEEFEPIRNIVYGMVAVILLAVVGAILRVVVRK